MWVGPELSTSGRVGKMSRILHFPWAFYCSKTITGYKKTAIP